MGISASALISKFQYALDNRWGYIFGKAGTLWTSATQKQLEEYMVRNFGTSWKTNSEARGDKYYWSAYRGNKWVGHYVADCSGLFVWAYKAFSASIAHGSNSIWRGYCNRKGSLKNGLKEDGSALIPGTAVFVYKEADNNRSHIGLYIGNGKVIEAAGTADGVCQSDVTDKKWNEWGELKAVDYSDSGFPDVPTWHPTIRRGSKGEDVTLLQQYLDRLGYDLGPSGVDGDYGRRTEQAVREFQGDHGLGVDGVCGPMTWDTIEKAVQRLDSEPQEKRYTVTIHHLDKTRSDALKAEYPDAVITEE